MSTPYANAVLADSPFMYNKLLEASGTFADSSSGGTRPLTFNAATARAATALNNDTGAASIHTNGTNYSASHAFDATIPQTGNFTVECLIQPASVTGQQSIIGNGSGGSQGWVCGISGTSMIYIVNSVAIYTSSVASLFAIGTNYHCAWVIDTTPQVTFYVNGSQVGTPKAIGAEVANTSHAFTVGAGDTFNDTPFSGFLSDVAIYSAALTSTQVSTHSAAVTAGGGGGGGIWIPRQQTNWAAVQRSLR